MSGSQAALWPVRPKPIDGEILSSWLSRVGEGFGLSLQQFRKLCLPKVPGLGSDVDLVGDVPFFELLAARSGISCSQATSLGLVSEEGRVFLDAPKPDWIVLLRTAGESGKVAALPFCPSCITAGVPFYRKSWRYAFHPVCSEHGLLTTNCPRCGAPYSYLGDDHRGTAIGSGTMHMCRTCETRFSGTAPQDMGDETLQSVADVQNELMIALNDRWIEIDGDGPIPIALYLHGLRLIAALFADPDLAPGIAAFCHCEGGAALPPWNRSAWSGSIESRTAPVRAWILLSSTWLTKEWPDRFVAMAKTIGVSPTKLLGGSRPAWMNCGGADSQFYSAPRAQQIEEARALLARLMQWPPTASDVQAFMLTGRVPKIRPLARKASEPIPKLASESSSSAFRRQGRSRELYAPVESDPAQLFDEDIEEASQDKDGVGHMLRARNRSRRRPE